MKNLTTVLALAAVMFAAPAFASTHKEAPEMKAPGSCEATAAEKKLSGAAKNSFLKKCNATPKTECDLKAGEKKLAGAAKNSFLKKCKADAAAMAASAGASAAK